MPGQQLHIRVLPTTVFTSVIAVTAQHVGLPTDQLRFMCFGKRLCGFHRLGEFGLDDGDTVDMFDEQCGGGGPCMFADVSNSGTVVHLVKSGMSRTYKHDLKAARLQLTACPTAGGTLLLSICSRVPAQLLHSCLRSGFEVQSACRRS